MTHELEVWVPEEQPILGNPTGEKCPKCSGTVLKVKAKCPDDQEGCLVAHYRRICRDCGSWLRVKVT